MSFYATGILAISAVVMLVKRITGRRPTREPPEDKARRLLQDIKQARSPAELDKLSRQARFLINSTPNFTHYSKLLHSQIKQQTCRLKSRSTAN